MNIVSCSIVGGDFDRAGSASKTLKGMLTRIGYEPKIIRKAMIAAYEAEMNVVIHARNGIMEIALEPDRLEVGVIDEGPGIEDIDRAMETGFSTANEYARELGFGAGMGLPNIKKNADYFVLDSEPGRGTRLHFVIDLKPEEAYATGRNSIHIQSERCRLCFRCLLTCPTQAIRLYAATPSIRTHRCIDCAECLQVCPDRVFGMVCSGAFPKTPNEVILVIPTAFLAQFNSGVGPSHLLPRLLELGFREVWTLHSWEWALREAVDKYAEGNVPKPVIAPVCLSVLNLIRLQFPGLLGHIAPFYSPLEAVHKTMNDHAVTYIASCPAQVTALKTMGLNEASCVMSPELLWNTVTPLVSVTSGGGNDDGHSGDLVLDDHEGSRLRITGIKHVTAILEQMELGLLSGVSVLDMYACEQGCWGAPYWRTEPHVAQFRTAKTTAALGETGRAVRRPIALRPHKGIRLDADPAKAIEKLTTMDNVFATLPGRDCGQCGAPSCDVFAEDIVLGNVTLNACVHKPKEATPCS